VGAKSGRNKRGGKGGPKKAAAPRTANSGRGRAQRFGLIAFAIVFIALFVVFAVAQGLGSPKVPSGDVALVQGVPSDLGHISEEQFKTAMEQQQVKAGLKKAPKAGSKKAEELKKSTLEELIKTAWIVGEGEDLGIKVTPKEVETELAKVKKESFKTEKQFEEFLTESHLDSDEVNQLLELNLYQKKIEEKIKKESPPVEQAVQEEYYEAEKATQFTKKPSRDVRVAVSENKKEIEEAQKALEADHSKKGWEAATKKYSPTTEANAGLQKEISEEFLQEPLKKDIFGAKTGELIGPVKQEKSYLLLEVVKLHAEKVQTFAEVKTTIASTLGQEKEGEFFSNWVRGFEAKWTAATYCGSGYEVAQCGNVAAALHLKEIHTQYKTCFEAEPAKAPTECPAAVQQNAPTLPGIVTRLKPNGEPLVQRPQPLPAAKEGGKAALEAAGGAAAAEEAAGNEGATGASPEQEAAAQKAVEEAEQQAAEEAAKSGGETGGAEAGGAEEGAAAGEAAGSESGKKGE
jgi:parvulin-like peptidyl-prolyl isomerase